MSTRTRPVIRLQCRRCGTYSIAGLGTPLYAAGAPCDGPGCPGILERVPKNRPTRAESGARHQPWRRPCADCQAWSTELVDGLCGRCR